MNLFLLSAGVLLLGLVAFDFVYTTISANQTGPLARRSAAALWWFFSMTARHIGHRFMLRFAGPFVMIGVAVMWIALTSIGWLLIFRSDPGALVMKTSGAPAGWPDAYAFVGSSLSTVGSSNARAASALWDNMAMIAAVNGMVMLTLSATFVLNVTQTVATGRGFAALIGARDPANSANDDLLLPALSDICVRLNASPLALYYSSMREEHSLPLSLKWLAERAMTDPERIRQYCHLLRELPYLETDPGADTEQFLKAMEEWAARFHIERR